MRISPDGLGCREPRSPDPRADRRCAGRRPRRRGASISTPDAGGGCAVEAWETHPLGKMLTGRDAAHSASPTFRENEGCRGRGLHEPRDLLRRTVDPVRTSRRPCRPTTAKHGQVHEMGSRRRTRRDDRQAERGRWRRGNQRHRAAYRWPSAAPPSRVKAIRSSASSLRRPRHGGDLRVRRAGLGPWRSCQGTSVHETVPASATAHGKIHDGMSVGNQARRRVTE